MRIHFRSLCWSFFAVVCGVFAIYPGISAASDAVQDAGRIIAAGGKISLEAGTYIIKGTLQVPAHTQLTCSPGAVISDEGSSGSLITLNGSGTSITGCNFFVRGRPLIIMLAAGTSNLTLRDNFFQSSDNAIGILINVPGVHDVSLVGNRFDALNYGILQNTQAGDMINAEIESNSFTNLTGDGVELNNPSNSICCGKRLSDAKASKILIRNNRFDIPLPAKINSRAAGFCVGIAGAHDITVQHNNCKTWYQGIHIEDMAYNLTISDNTVTTNDPSDYAYQAGIWVIDGHDIDIEGNTITDALGDGIRIDYDPIHQATGLKIIDNKIRNCRRVGISIEAGSVGPIKAEIAANTVESCRKSIHLGGQQLREISLHDNKLSADSGCPIDIGAKVNKANLALSHNSLINSPMADRSGCFY